jgi:hypothetical protein
MWEGKTYTLKKVTKIKICKRYKLFLLIVQVKQNIHTKEGNKNNICNRHLSCLLLFKSTNNIKTYSYNRI